MTIEASIDIGTNSVRLLVASKNAAGLTPLYRDLITTRIGEGIGHTKYLKDEAIARTADAVARFYKQAKDTRAENIYIFATSAVRDAYNKQVFLDAVQRQIGVFPEVISGEEEAHLSYVGAVSAIRNEEQEKVVVIDIGGGSTEIICKQKAIQGKSIPIGAVRLSENPLTHKQLYKIFEDSVQSINIKKSTLIGVGGTVTSLAAIIQELEPYDPEKIHGYRLRTSDVKSVTERLYTLTIEERKKLKGLHPERADIILFGAEILLTLLCMFSAEEIIVSESDLLQGRILKGS